MRFEKIYPHIIFISVGYLIWWSPDFWNPDTYFNIGDVLFPFKPGKHIASIFYSWNENANEGLGSGNTYSSGIILYYYALIGFFKVIGVPLWLCNRLFFLIPTWMMLIASYYMLLPFIETKYKERVAILGSIFLTTSPPLMDVAPIIHLAVVGVILLVSSLIRFLKEQDNYYLIIIALSTLLMTSMPRYLYLSLIFVFFYMVSWLLIANKNVNKINLRKIIILLIIAGSLIALLNFFTFLPTATFLFYNASSGLMPNKEIFLNRIDVVDFYKGTSSLLYSIRLINNDLYSLHFNYFSNEVNLLISFLLILFLFIPFILKENKKKEIFIILFMCLFLLFFVFIFGSELYKVLMKIIPGFWIINNPQYILMYLALCYSILIVNSLSFFANKCQEIKTKKRRFLTIILFIGIFVIIIINNGIYFFDKIPNPRKMFITKEKQDIAMGNHLPYFKIPSDYNKINEFAKEEDLNARVLVLPFLIDGYMRYKWWPYYTMPEITTQITSLRMGGISFQPSNRLIRIKEELLNERYYNAFDIMKLFGYKYILVHKDMITYNYFFDEELKDYLLQLPTAKDLDTVLDNEYFRLYKLKES